MVRWFPLLMLFSTLAAAKPAALTLFQIDATPPLGCPLELGFVRPAETVADRLSARGLVLLNAGKPIVLVAVDWIGIGNEGQDMWRKALAEAAGTSRDRVVVHTLHQHDAPGHDPFAERLMDDRGLGGSLYCTAFANETVARAAAALREAMGKPRPVTHIGLGRAKVEQVASNRRILGADGKVKHMRFSSCKDPAVRAEPEGVIDPYVRIISFWYGDRPLAALTYYATHPQSYYGKGGISADFVGMARSTLEKDLPRTMHIHFNGAGGNVAAGKYNDGTPPVRPVLAARLAAGIKAAWRTTSTSPLRAEDIGWQVLPVVLPLSERLRDEAGLRKVLDDPASELRRRKGAALDLAFSRRGGRVQLACLKLGQAYVLYMPGELFVEYQLAAVKMKPEHFVAMAAYGDYGPGYIGTRIAYSQGGYETGPASGTAPEVEDVLMNAMRKLLR